jgi:hypothetical protein
MTARPILLPLLAGVMLLLAPATAGAKTPPKWKVGDRVEAYDIYSESWEAGTIFLVEDYRPSSPLYYKARLDRLPAGTSQNELLLTEAQVRPVGAGASAKKLEVGTVVDVYFADGRGKNRGTILMAMANGRYKIRYAGCTKTWDEVVDALAVKPPPALARSDARIRFLVGKWVMFTPSYPNTVIHDDQVIREYGTGAKSPPLQINADGTYVWYFDFGKPPVKGRWIVDSKTPKTDMGTQSVDGVLVDDPTGQPWKVYRWRPPHDKLDRITTQQMCSGVTDIGQRA